MSGVKRWSAKRKQEVVLFCRSDFRLRAEQHVQGLGELSTLDDQRPLSFNERSAVERSLQVPVEMAVGCSKHVL